MKRIIIWIAALVVGAVLGTLGVDWLNSLMDFLATVYTRLFQFVAVPTIALAVITTLSSFGTQKNTGRICLHTITYTLLTTICAAAVGLLLYVLISPGNLPVEVISRGKVDVPDNLGSLSYYDHILSVVPSNIIQPFANGNVLSILLISAAIGLGIAYLLKNDNENNNENSLERKNLKTQKLKNENILIVYKGIVGLQELLFTLIKALIWALPLGIVAFAAQLSAQISAGVIVGTE